jgi:hypothetical protein
MYCLIFEHYYLLSSASPPSTDRIFQGHALANLARQSAAQLLAFLHRDCQLALQLVNLKVSFLNIKIQNDRMEQ